MTAVTALDRPGRLGPTIPPPPQVPGGPTPQPPAPVPPSGPLDPTPGPTVPAPDPQPAPGPPGPPEG